MVMTQKYVGTTVYTIVDLPIPRNHTNNIDAPLGIAYSLPVNKVVFIHSYICFHHNPKFEHSTVCITFLDTIEFIARVHEHTPIDEVFFTSQSVSGDFLQCDVKLSMFRDHMK